MKRILVLLAVAASVTAGLLYSRAGVERQRAREMARIEDQATVDDLHLDLQEVDTTRWIRTYVPEDSLGGYTLALHRWRVPILIDMNGRVVHTWPMVRAMHRARLNRQGRLVVIGTDRLVKEYDWDGRLTWFFRLQNPDDFFHHDLIQLRNGNYLLLVRDKASRTGYLQEVNRRGEVVWEWRSLDHERDFPSWNWERPRKDPTHINSIREIPSNRWFRAGDERFRPGNILVSARHLDTIFIIDKRSGEVVWQYSQGLDYQHEAVMIEEGELGEGMILLFNNGRHNVNGYRRSLVQAIDPTAGEVVWEYASEFFFSSVGGVVQKLRGPNVLVTSSHGGRVFEITPNGKIVWEWVPPYIPWRVERVASDHCPQLAALTAGEAKAVKPANRRPYVDKDLYKFGLQEDFVSRTLAGRERNLLRATSGCETLLIPPRPSMHVEYGIDEERLRGRSLSARFRLTIEEDGRLETLVDDVVDSDSERLWRETDVRLAEFRYKRVELCLSVEADGEMKKPLRMVAWANPGIRSWLQHPPEQRARKAITEEEKELRKQQLEALGYVN